jgi:tetratricopeptide (TPR) repeat protein
MKNELHGWNDMEADPLKFFVGRDQELTTLRAWIGRSHPRPMAITGMAGMGKTTLARAFASSEAAGGRRVVWITSLGQYEESTLQDLVQPLRQVELGLLVVDDVEDVDTLRRAISLAGGNPLLFIAQDASLGEVGHVLQLEPLPSRESAQLVNALMPSAGAFEAQALVDGLEGLPLAIFLASRLAREPEGMQALLSQLDLQREGRPGAEPNDNRRAAKEGRALYEEATQLLKQGEYQAAVSALRAAGTMLNASLGSNHPDSIAARSELGRVLAESGNASESIAILLDVVSSAERSFGKQARPTLRARADLAEGLRRSGNVTAAYLVLDSLVPEMVSFLGEHHPEVLSAQANLAVVARASGDHRRALTIQDEVVRYAQETFDSDHPFVLSVRSNFAAMLEDNGYLDQSVQVQRSVVADSERTLGTEHPDTLLSVHNLGSTLYAIGKVDESLHLETRVYAMSKKTLGLRDNLTLSALNSLLIALLSLHRATEALALLQDLLDDRSAQKGYDTGALVSLCGSLTSWAESAIEEGQFDLANEVLLAVLELSAEWPVEIFPSFSSKILALQSQLQAGPWSDATDSKLRVELTVRRLARVVSRWSA